MNENVIFVKLDVTGHKCPVPVFRLRRTLEQMAKGETLRLLASDPMTQIDIPHFCQQAGHRLLKMTKKDDVFHFLIKKAGE